MCFFFASSWWRFRQSQLGGLFFWNFCCKLSREVLSGVEDHQCVCVCVSICVCACVCCAHNHCIIFINLMWLSFSLLSSTPSTPFCLWSMQRCWCRGRLHVWLRAESGKCTTMCLWGAVARTVQPDAQGLGHAHAARALGWGRPFLDGFHLCEHRFTACYGCCNAAWTLNHFPPHLVV